MGQSDQSISKRSALRFSITLILWFTFQINHSKTKGLKWLFSTKKQTRPEVRTRLEPVLPAFSSQCFWPLPQECQCRAQENLHHRHLSSSSFYFVHFGWNFCGNRRYTGALPDGKQIKVRVANSMERASVNLMGFSPLPGTGEGGGRTRSRPYFQTFPTVLQNKTPTKRILPSH